jgi:recombination protein RecR
MTFCRRCWNIADRQGDDISRADRSPDDPDGTECELCRDPRRDVTLLCVVEEPRDIAAIEKTQEYKGRYHVLQGTLNPIEGVGPDQLRIKELFARLGNEPIAEVILCTNPNLEGETTAMYLARQLQPLGINVTRLASGLPVGGDLEYADELTLGRALEGRRAIEG